MNIQRFTAVTSREAMAKARNAFGDSAVILSSRATDDGFEVMAAAEESLAPMAATTSLMPRADRIAPIVTRRSGSRPGRPPQFEDDDDESVEADTEALAMSTLSFQDYVRERMLRKRRGESDDEPAAVAPPVARAAKGPAPRAAAPAPMARSEVQEAPAVAQAVQQAAPAMPAQPQRTAIPQPIVTRNSASADRTPTASMSYAGSTASASSVAAELTALKDLMEERFNTLAWLGNTRQNPVQSQLMLKLIRAGYSPAMSRAVLDRVPANSAAPEAQRWVQDTINRNVKASAPGQTLCDEGGVIALIGATGVGKTTTAAKLAAQCIKQYGAGSVGLITLDTYRVSGYEQLRSYGRMLGVVAHLAHDRAALKDLLTLLEGKRMVLIDTAGLGQRDQRIQDMLDVLDMPSIKKVLVLNAGSHGDTLDDVLTAFKASTLHGVVLSKVDEAVKLGPSIDALIRHQVVLRGVANGQRVPEDWQEPDANALVRMSFGTEGKSAYDPLPSEMGLYFSQASSMGLQMGSSHV
ncbi:flagellar biosynthesis protein FlhF [Hydrogenophaga crassostreae]|uniref:Flagellar biosynthesis protein FlhF n=1 Tax=Hydrogenophaga crassostreae TaxID=1763535 RepID=A0A167HGX5_9BURK|nr:flagellar biosynthesis protein FlhF [Hydrogenophaga crassostreae]AOW12234.1 flagellar biosynthesis protein FlhF [Hydrogenophaga crassostreae]OAD41180.1 flagellar biosynthesis protein FlhF [Hydrogenophaga crassostreae]